MNPNELLAQTVAQLQNQLQAIHERLGAPATQNVRNLEPAHVTIVKCLPTRQCDAINKADLWVEFQKKGGRVAFHSFGVTLSNLVTGGKVDAIRFNNVACQHYYFRAY